MLEFCRRYIQRTLSRRNVLFTILFALSSAVIGPLGTFMTMDFSGRFVLWGGAAVLALLIGGLISQIVVTFSSNLSRLTHGFWMTVGFCVVFPILMTWISQAQFLTDQPPLLGYLEITLVITCFSITFGLMVGLMDQDDVGPPLPQLYARLPNVGTARICRLTASDHYTDVYMSDATLRRLLLRFADAVKKMDDTKGFCTHRSHWVAQDYILSAVRQGIREFVVLMDETQVPVSKTYRPGVVAAGFL